MSDTNPRAVVGDNTQTANYAAEVTARLERDYEESFRTLDALMDEAGEAPKEANDDETALTLGALVKRLRDTDAKLEAFRVAEKEPFLRGGEGVDTLFFKHRERIGRRSRTAKPGAADVLQSRIDSYQQRKLAEEKRRRDEEARRLAEEARRKAEAEEAERRRAEEARLAAERARKPENKTERQAVADAAAESASRAGVETELATQNAQAARIDTFAKPSEMARTKGGDGTTITMAKENYAIVVDRTKLDWKALSVFFKDDEIEKALRGWARTTNFSQQMDGAEIGSRSKTVVR